MLNVWKKNSNYKSKSPINENVEISVYKEINETPLNDFKEIPYSRGQELPLNDISIIPMPVQIPNIQEEKNIQCEKSVNKMVEYDDVGNKFIITKNDYIKCVIPMDEIINSIINTENINNYIKEFIFIVSPNLKSNTYEYNFIDSVFTQNLKMMIKLYNEIYLITKTIDFNEAIPDKIKYNNNIITFFYQLILFIFKTTILDKNTDDKTLIIAYSTMTFCFNEILLKQTLVLKSKYNVFEKQLKDNNLLIEKIYKNIGDMNNQQTTNITSENITSENMTTENMTTENMTTGSVPKSINNGNIMGGGLLDSVEFNSDNGFKEISEETEDKSNNTNIVPSYNTKSAVNNSKILTL